jgi:hypothetical protein
VLREPSQRRKFLQVLLEGFSGNSPENKAGAVQFLVRKNASSRPNNNTRADGSVIAHPNLAADDGIVADDGAAGDASLGGDDDIPADPAVVADVDEVVDLGPLADAGLFESAAVDGGVGADLDVVFDDQGALLGKLGVSAGCRIADIAEAVCAEDSTGVDNDAVAESDAGVDGDARMEDAVPADRDIICKNTAGGDGCTLADGGVADHCTGMHIGFRR